MKILSDSSVIKLKGPYQFTFTRFLFQDLTLNSYLSLQLTMPLQCTPLKMHSMVLLPGQGISLTREQLSWNPYFSGLSMTSLDRMKFLQLGCEPGWRSKFTGICGTVGSAVASDTRDLQFKSHHRIEIYLPIATICNVSSCHSPHYILIFPVLEKQQLEVVSSLVHLAA